MIPVLTTLLLFSVLLLALLVETIDTKKLKFRLFVILLTVTILSIIGLIITKYNI